MNTSPKNLKIMYISQSLISLRLILLGLIILCLASPIVAQASKDGDPVSTDLNINYFEVRLDNDKDPVFLDADAKVGTDLHKLVVTLSIKPIVRTIEEVESQLLYSYALTANWDMQLGWRHDDPPTPTRDWLVAGFTGVGPYEIDTGVFLFVGEDDRVTARLELDYEWMLAQKWSLAPDLEINAYSKDDNEFSVGSGISYAELGLRLSYAVLPKASVYIGVVYDTAISETRDILERAGDQTSDSVAVVGFSAWF